VSSAGLAWIEAAGSRVLPPIETPELTIARYDFDAEAEWRALLTQDPENTTLVRFRAFGKELQSLIDLHHGGPWRLPKDRIPDLNRVLQGSVTVIASSGELP
jgi:hypothetical protein